MIQAMELLNFDRGILVYVKQKQRSASSDYSTLALRRQYHAVSFGPDRISSAQIDKSKEIKKKKNTTESVGVKGQIKRESPSLNLAHSIRRPRSLLHGRGQMSP